VAKVARLSWQASNRLCIAAGAGYRGKVLDKMAGSGPVMTMK